MVLSFKLSVSWLRCSGSRLLLLFLFLLLFNSACVKNVHSVSNDNFYIVKAPHDDLKRSANQVKLHEDAALKTERPKGSKAPTAKTSVTNADLVEQKYPVVAALMEKIRHNPNDPQNHNELAFVCHRMLIFDTALSEYGKAIELDPKNPQPYEGAGRLLRDWGTPASGISYLERALELRPSFVEAWNTLGTVYDRLRSFSEAQRCYLRALAINSHLDFVHNNLCFSYLQTGDVKAAVYHGEMAVQLNPDLVEARNNLGIAYGMTDDFARAIEQFKRIGDEGEAHNKLGVLLLKREKNVAALEEFKLAVKLKPFYKVAVQNYNTARNLAIGKPEQARREWSNEGLAAPRPLDTSFGADSLDFSIPLVDLRFIDACSDLWAFCSKETGQEKLVRPEVDAVKEYESSQVLHRSPVVRN